MISRLAMALPVIAALAFPVKAQILYGAQVGTSVATFLPAANGYGGKPGIQAGGQLNYSLNSSFGLVGYAGYSWLRPTLAESLPTAGSTTALRSSVYEMHFAEAGVMARYLLPIPMLADMSPSVTAGGLCSYNFYTRQERVTTLQLPSTSYSGTGSEVVTGSFNPFLVSLQGALRFDFPLTTAPVKACIFEVGYRYVLNSVFNSAPAYSATGSADDLNMSVVYTTFGVKF
jgi:hypothetical protein